jgi:RNA polymerase sigma factor (sigma-70 family)
MCAFFLFDNANDLWLICDNKIIMIDTTETPLPDNQLWQALLQGDEAAFTVLYRTHLRAMYRYGMSLVPASEAFVLDCIHDVFAEIWFKRTRLTSPNNVKFYLLKSLKTRILHLLQRQEKPTKSLSYFDFDDLWSEPSPEETFISLEDSHNKETVVKKLIDQLPPRQQEALRLRFVEDMDFNEIADVLGVNRQSAQNLVFRSLEKLRHFLKQVSI